MNSSKTELKLSGPLCVEVLKSEVLEAIEENCSVFNQSEIIFVFSGNSNVKAMLGHLSFSVDQRTR